MIDKKQHPDHTDHVLENDYVQSRLKYAVYDCRRARCMEPVRNMNTSALADNVREIEISTMNLKRKLAMKANTIIVVAHLPF